MKKILFTTGVLLGWAACASAADNVTLSASEYKALIQRMDALQQDVDSMQGGSSGRKRGGSARTMAVETKYDKLAQDVSGIYDTLDVVETKALQDRINLGGELRTRVDNFTMEDETSGTLVKNNNHWSSRFRLNMDAEISRGLTFNGRLAVFKNWADSTPYALTADYNQAHVPAGDTSLKLDRAYIDWVPQGFFLPLAITFGRQPSSEGPPLEYREGKKRQSTYPGLIFDGESDGIVMTLGLERYIKMRNSGLRLFYAKGYQQDSASSPFYEADPNNPSEVSYEDTNVVATFFESEIPGVRNSLMVLSYVRAYDFITQDMAGNIGGNIGDMEIYGLHLQASNVGNSGLDIFLSGGANESHPNGVPAGYPGLLTNFGEEGHSGWAIFTGLRYTMPIKALNDPQIGIEYNKGSQYWFSFTPGGTEVYNKLGTRGEVYDFYYIQPFNKNLFLRVGYTQIMYDYSYSGFPFGEPMPMELVVENAYAVLDAHF